jgi:hypothetical protein
MKVAKYGTEADHFAIRKTIPIALLESNRLAVDIGGSSKAVCCDYVERVLPR